MPDPALESALSAVAATRQQRIQTKSSEAIAQEINPAVIVSASGYSDGPIATLPNGGTIPVTPASNGSLPEGSVIIANRANNSAYGNWMPQ